jgi:hypothetical protein
MSYYRISLTALALLCGAAATTSLAAQQPASTQQAGPRLAAPLARFDPSAPRAAASPAYLAAVDLNDRHTLVISTLGIILVVVILLLVL